MLGVVAALDGTPAFNVPYGSINSGMPRGLAIAYAFPPYADTSAVVSAKRIRERGTVVDVVYNAMGSIRSTDDTLRRISGPFVGDEAAVHTPSYFSSWRSMESFAVEGMKVIRSWETAKGAYGLLYSRAHFAASHFLAAAYKLSNPAATWRAEFSDPLSRDVSHQERGTPIAEGPFLRDLRAGLYALGVPVPTSTNCLVWCEEVAYALADELIFTNTNQMEYMLDYCSDGKLAATARAKATIAPHPTLPRHFYSMVDYPGLLDQGLVHLAYSGNFYATRDLDDVLGAVAGLDASVRDRLRLHVFTTKPNDLELRAGQIAISEAVQAAPYVRYLEFLNMATRFDCLIVADAVTRATHIRNPYLPSKLADYLGSGTPVWGLVEEGSTLSSQELDFRSPIGDVVAAASVLTAIVREKLEAARAGFPAGS